MAFNLPQTIVQIGADIGNALLGANNLSEITDPVAAQQNLQLELGTDVQAADALLDDLVDAAWAQGDTLYYDGSNFVVLPAGNTFDVLTMNATVPTWAEAPKAWSESAVSSLSGGDATVTGFSDVKEIELYLNGVSLTDTSQIALRIGGTSLQSGGYVGGYDQGGDGGTNSTIQWRLCDGNASHSFTGKISLVREGDTDTWQMTATLYVSNGEVISAAGSKEITNGELNTLTLESSAAGTFDAGTLWRRHR